MNFNIGVFCYNFPHRKTYDGLLNLYVHGFKPKIVLAQDRIKLNIKDSKLKIHPTRSDPMDPEQVCSGLSLDYKMTIHNSEECKQIIEDLDLDIGVILGARILSKDIIDAFNIGIINMHPGLIPYNRGLDNIKWAIMKGQPQGVTTHLIDRHIDMGRIIDRRIMNVLPDDSLRDLGIRILDLELQMLIEALNSFSDRISLKKVDHDGNYFAPLEWNTEQYLEDEFVQYKKNYENIKLLWGEILNE